MDLNHKTKEELIAMLQEMQQDMDTLSKVSMEKAHFAWDILDSISDGFMTLNSNLEITYFNHAAENSTGVKREDAIGKHVKEAFSFANISVAETSFKKALETGDPQTYEILRDNEQYGNWYAVRVCPYEKGLSVYFQVITEKKLAEQALLTREEQFRALAELAPIAIVVHRNKMIKYMNATGLRYVRARSLSDVLGKSILDFIAPEYFDEVYERYSRLEQIGDYFTGVEEKLVRMDGTLFDVEVQGKVIPFGGEPAVQLIIQDTSERKEAIRALKESEERLKLVLTAAEVGTWDWDVQAGKVSYDKNWAAMIGYQVEELAPKISTWYELLHPDDAGPANEMLEEHLSGKTELYETEFRMRHKDGRWKWIHTKGKVIEFSDDGKPLRAIGTHLDISERIKHEDEQKRLEERMQHAQKLESLGVLAGGIAHDFNNLLVGILGNAELALPDIPLSSSAYQCVREISRAATRAADLSRQMLAYSGKGKFVIETILLKDIIEEMSSIFRASVPKNILIRLDFDPATPRVDADITQLRQVLMNLVVNSGEAIGEKSGIISIRTGLLECDSQYLEGMYPGTELKPGTYAFLEVSDNGEGMNNDTLSKIFDPFFTTKFVGRGLGLAAVLGIIRGHDGGIKVYSEPKSGTSFKILLPATKHVEEESSESYENTVRYQGSGAVLIADDEQTVLTVASKMLTKMGFSILLAENGREALEVFKQHRDEIAVVLLDLTMPHLDGEAVFSQMKALRQDVKVILTSGYNEQDIMNRFSGKGLAGFIHKPFKFKDLEDVLRQVQSTPDH